MRKTGEHRDTRRRSRGVIARLDLSARDWAALLGISLVVAAMGVLGASYVAGQGWRSFDAPLAVVLIVLATAVVAAALLAIDAGIFRLASRGRLAGEGRREKTPSSPKEGEGTSFSGGKGKALPLLDRLTPRWSARSIALFSVIMALFWLPWLVANFPGGTYWDTYYQIFQCYPENHPIAIIPYAECKATTVTDAYLCDHHPVVVTLIYGAFGMASDALTGNWMAGVFAFVCLQGAAHVVAFTAAIAYLRDRRCPVALCFAAYVFLCVMPFVSTWAMCMVKDSLFGLLYIPYLIMLFECVRTKGGSLSNTRTAVLFIIVGLLLCLTKKQGIYVVVPTALIAAWIYRKSLARDGRKAGHAEGGARFPHGGGVVFATQKGARGGGCPDGRDGVHGSARAGGLSEAAKAFLSQALLCLLVTCVVFPVVVFPAFNIAPGGKQEVLGTLFQQTARYVTYNPGEVTEEERAVIDQVLEYDNLKHQYTYNFQDEVKYRYNLDATTDDLVEYLKVWAAQGARDPECYLASVMSIAGYYTAPCGINNIRMVTVDTHMGEDNRYMLWNPDELDWLRNGLDEAYEAIATTPVLGLPLLMVVYVFWLPAALLFVMWRRRLKCGVLLVPALVLLAFLIIAPVNDARYCVPLFNGAPLMLCMVVALLRAKIEEQAVSSPKN